MAVPVSLKSNATSGVVPEVSDLVDGELALNTADGILFAKLSGATPSIANIGGPNFGSKNLSTTGTLSCGNVAVTSATVPAYGLYKVLNDTLAIAVNSVPTVYINNNGRIGINAICVDGTIVRLFKSGTSTAHNVVLGSGGVGDPSVVDPSLTFAGSAVESEGTTVIKTAGTFGSRYLSISTGSDAAGVERVQVRHNGFIRLTSNSGGLQFNSDAFDYGLNDYERGWYNWAHYFKLLNTSTGQTFNIFHESVWNAQGNYIKIGEHVEARLRVQGIFNSDSAGTTYDAYTPVFVLPTALSVVGTDYGPGRVIPVGQISYPQIGNYSYMVNAGVSTNYAYTNVVGDGTWGALKAALGSAPNYQFYVQVSYISA